MIEAYILVQTEVGRANTVADNASGLTGIISTEVVAGPYDLILRAKSADEATLRTNVLPGVQQLPNVTRTLTCPILTAR